MPRHQFSTIYLFNCHIVAIIFSESTEYHYFSDKSACLNHVGQVIEIAGPQSIVAASYQYVESDFHRTAALYDCGYCFRIKAMTRYFKLRELSLGKRGQSVVIAGRSVTTAVLAKTRFGGNPARRILYSNAR